MARPRPEVKELSHGLYERFDAAGRDLPKLERFATTVPLRVGQEFGYVLKIVHGRGLKIEFEIDHPRVPGADGAVMEPFRGEQRWRGWRGATPCPGSGFFAIHASRDAIYVDCKCSMRRKLGQIV